MVPVYYTAKDDVRCPEVCGIGFVELLQNYCETNSCNISDAMLSSGKATLYDSINQHMQRASQDCQVDIDECYPRVIAFSGVRQFKALFSDEGGINKSRKNNAIDRKIGRKGSLDRFISSSKSDHIINLVGNDDSNRADPHDVVKNKAVYGIQQARPKDWPILLSKSILYLLPSSSGAAALTNEVRETPYIQLGELLQGVQYEYVKSMIDGEGKSRDIVIPAWKP